MPASFAMAAGRWRRCKVSMRRTGHLYRHAEQGIIPGTAFGLCRGAAPFVPGIRDQPLSDGPAAIDLVSGRCHRIHAARSFCRSHQAHAGAVSGAARRIGRSTCPAAGGSSDRGGSRSGDASCRLHKERVFGHCNGEIGPGGRRDRTRHQPDVCESTAAIGADAGILRISAAHDRGRGRAAGKGCRLSANSGRAQEAAAY